MEQDQKAWTTVAAFIEGQLDNAAFEQRLYHDNALAAALQAAGPLPPWLPSADLYSWALSLDLSRSDHLLDLRSVLSDVLAARGVEVQMDPLDGQRLEAMLSAQPRWLSLDPAYLAQWQSGQTDTSPTALKRALRAHIRDAFVSAARPPRWLQEPAWPIIDGQALRFIGQLALGSDDLERGVVYVFQSTSGTFTLVTQHT